ncbi:MAG: tetratricopeptide repeat protein, partial [Gemmatimonadaceae bacterium]
MRRKSDQDAANVRLQQQIADDPGDARAHYRLAVLLLASRDLYEFYAPDEAGILDRAARLLERAVQLDPQSADSQAALGFTYHQIGKKLDRALECFKAARRLDREDETVDVYVPTILVEMEREKEAHAEIGRVAKRRKIDLKKLRRQFAEAGWKGDAAMLLSDGFIRARNFLWSRLTDEAEAIRNSIERGRKGRLAKAALAECAAFQRELAREFRASRVPKDLRPLSAAAKRYGIGDDVCR